MQDPYERRALLLHLGDVLEAVFCLSKCAAGYASIAEALRREESLAGLRILALVDPKMRPDDFIQRASGAFFVWPKALLEESLNRPMLAHTVQHDLFAGNVKGWEAYVSERKKDVPWFGDDLPKMTEASSVAVPEAPQDAPPKEAKAEEAKAEAAANHEESSSAREARYSTWPWRPGKPS
jgi:hypothetical protein